MEKLVKIIDQKLVDTPKFPHLFSELIHHMDEVNDELLKKITNIKVQPPQRNFKVEKAQQIHVPLNFESNAEEVRAWLEANSFSKG